MNTIKIDATENYKQLGYAVAVQAVRDFFDTVSERSREKIIKDLKSAHMDFITDGLSVILAYKLETEPEKVCARFKKAWAEELEQEQYQTNTFYTDLRMEQLEQM